MSLTHYVRGLCFPFSPFSVHRRCFVDNSQSADCDVTYLTVTRHIRAAPAVNLVAVRAQKDPTANDGASVVRVMNPFLNLSAVSTKKVCIYKTKNQSISL